jgi:rhodanese-related sulfurtransferase
MTTPAAIPSVDVKEAAARADADEPGGPVILDVREPDEFTTVRVDGSAHLPMSVFVQRIAELPKDRQLLVLCATGVRSAAVTGYLLRSGWSDVANIDGGITAWQKAGLPVRRGTVSAGEGDLPTG